MNLVAITTVCCYGKGTDSELPSNDVGRFICDVFPKSQQPRRFRTHQNNLIRRELIFLN